MTNILLLPTFNGPGTAFSVNNNADWMDEITFLFPGYPATAQIIVICSITANSNIVTISASSSTSSLIAGMPIVAIPGIPSNAFIGSVISSSQFTMIDGAGNPLNATATNPNVSITINPLPLNLSGIDFTADLRTSPSSAQVFLALSTKGGTLINGGVDGTISFSVPAATMLSIPPGNYVMDIVATAEGRTINMCEGGPATVTIVQGITLGAS